MYKLSHTYVSVFMNVYISSHERMYKPTRTCVFEVLIINLKVQVEGNPLENILRLLLFR